MDLEHDTLGTIIWQNQDPDKHTCTKFYDEKDPLHLDTDVFGVGLGQHY